MSRLADKLVNEENIKLTDVFYVNSTYSKNHAHMLHKHDGILEILYIESGEGRYIVGEREYAISKGDLVICNAGVLHGEAPFQQHSIETYCCAVSGFELCGFAKGQMICNHEKPVISLSGKFKNTVHEIMPNLYKFHTSSKLENKNINHHLTMSIIFIVLNVLQTHMSSSAIKMEQKNEDLVRSITDYLDNNYKRNITLKEVSEALHISVSHLSHLFKRETGIPPMQYITHRRIGEAQSLLMEGDLPINKIEELLGFSSSSHLTVMFKKYVGVSPWEYRKHFLKLAGKQIKEKG